MLAPIQGKNARTYPVASHYPMSLGSRRGLRLLQTRSQKLGIEVASWHHHPNIKTCNENLVRDEYHLLITCSTYKVICENYDNLLNRHDNVDVILKYPPRRVSAYECALFSHREFLLQSNNAPSLEGVGLILNNKISILFHSGLESQQSGQHYSFP